MAALAGEQSAATSWPWCCSIKQRHWIISGVAGAKSPKAALELLELRERVKEASILSVAPQAGTKFAWPSDGAS